MLELQIDGQGVEVSEGSTLLEAAARLGIRIPTLCHLPGYPDHTSCMVCLVEDLGQDALVPACATPARSGQRIRSGGQRVAAARRRSLELLLSEHAGDCEAPCTRACPAHPDLPAMIRRIAREDPGAARTVLLDRLPLAGTLAAICPAPCERACRRGRLDSPVAIRALRQAALLGEPAPLPQPAGGGAVAVVGGGPAGLAAAYFLARRGHRCTVFEERGGRGGSLGGLVAEGRLPAAVLDRDLAELERLGVLWRCGEEIGPGDLAAMRKTHGAVVLATGAPARLGALVPGTSFDRRTTAGTLPGLFACGNATRPRPSALAVHAVADGRRAALAAAAFLQGLPVAPETRRFDSHLETFQGALTREELAALAADAPGTAEAPGAADAPGTAEALRCLRCDCIGKRSCRLRELAGEYDADARHFAGEKPEAATRTARRKLSGSHGLRLDPGKCIKCGICVRIAEGAGERPGLAFSGRGYDLRLRVPFDQDLGAALGASARECVRGCPTGALAWCPPARSGFRQGGRELMSAESSSPMSRRPGAIAVLLVCAALAGAAFARPLPAGAEPLRPRPDFWPTFRGDSGLSGVAPSSLPRTLSLRWSFQTGDTVKSSPVAADGRLYIGSSDGKVYCLQAASGRKLWEYDTGAPVEAPPLTDGESVYVGTLDGTLLRLDAATGRKRWGFETAARIAGSANLFRRGGSSRPLVLVGSYDGTLYALDGENGRPAWTYSTDNYINGAPALTGNLAVVGGCDARLHVVSALDGTPAAAVDTGAYIAASPALAGGRAYVGNYADRLVCVDLGTGRIVWEYENDRPGGAFFSSPAADPSAVVVGSRDGRLHCVDARTGARRWAYETGAPVDGSAVIAGDRVIFGSGDGRLTILDLADGRETWSYEVGEPITGSVAVVGGLVVVGCDDGRVYAFGE